MVRELERQRQGAKFPESAPAANPVFFRTYSRRSKEGLRETWEQVCDRTLQGLVELGKLTAQEAAIVERMQRNLKSLPSGRWLWVGGTDWLAQQKNFSGAYNCTSTNLVDWRSFGLMMDLAMMGSGTGAVLEPQYIDQLPVIRNRVEVRIEGEIGSTPIEQRREATEVKIDGNQVTIYVGDSRQGWVKSYQTLLELSSDDRFSGDVEVIVNLSDVRQAGETLKGFGGVANPVKLPGLYARCAAILNKAVGRRLNSVECCLLIDEAAVCIVAGNIRRCLPEDALVHTEAGLVPIAKVRIGDRVLSSKGFYPVTNLFIQGEQSLCRIKTEDGFFECTADHKVAVFTDVYGNYKMLKAEDLQSGDRLVFVPQAIPGTPTELPEFRAKVESKAKGISVPALTPDVAYFIGYLHGDGSVSSDDSRVRFRVDEDSPKILEHLIAVGHKFGLETYTVRTPEQCRAKAYELQFNSSALNQYLKLFKPAFQPLNIPDCILLGTADIRKAYLAGLADANGCHSQGVIVASVHQRFLQQVQALYASLGITVRLGGSIGKGSGKWEGELVTVDGAAFTAVENFLSQDSIQFSSQKRQTPKSFPDHGFLKAMVGPIINRTQYHSGAIHQQMILPTRKKYVPEATDLVPVKVLGVELNVRSAPTYDIEVATVHEFVCEGILVSNSAGMRQGISEDNLFADAKTNLWQQDAQGNWRIDPERDALRMANHSRVFHHKPTLQECIDAVRKQYYSGEGAIQWAGEALVRANNDLLFTPELKAEFLQVYEGGEAKQWLQEKYPNLDGKELEHRLGRYGLNPCITADTWIHTEKGARQVKDLIGIQQAVYVNGELFSTTPEGFFFTGVKPVVKVQTKEGYSLRLTENHQLLKVTAQTQKKQYSEWCEAGNLKSGDRILIHNHRNLEPWDGVGSFDEGWLLGNFLGDGCFCVQEANYSYEGKLRYSGDTQVEIKEYALTQYGSVKENCRLGRAIAKPNIFRTLLGFVPPLRGSKLQPNLQYFWFLGLTERYCALTLMNQLPKFPEYSQDLPGFYDANNGNNRYYEVSSLSLAMLANSFGLHHQVKVITPEIEQASYEFYRGFLRGLFDADGIVQGSQPQEISIRLSQSNLSNLEAVQRMLLRLGIASRIYQNRQAAGLRMLADSQKNLPEDFCKTSHELVIAKDSVYVFQQVIGFQEPKKAELLETLLSGFEGKLNCERFAVEITAIIPDGESAVYDCTVPGVSRFDANGIVAHNCGEIIGADFHCVSAETLLITKDGMHKIKDLIGCEVEIWNGKKWSQVTPFKTGSNRKLYRVRFGDGTYLDVTEHHRFFVKDRFGKEYKEVQTKDLMDVSQYSIHTEPFTIEYEDGINIDPNYAYTLGVAVGDKTTEQKNNAKVSLYKQKAALAIDISGKECRDVAMQRLYKGFGQRIFNFQRGLIAGNKSSQRRYNYLPAFKDVTDLDFSGEFLKSLKTNSETLNVIASWNRQAILHFVAGLADTNGSNTHSNGIRIYLSDYKGAYRIQLLLTKCGIRSSVHLCLHQDLYYLQITDCGEIPCQRLHVSKNKQAKHKGQSQVITTVEELPGLHDTYCFNEPEYHKGVFGNTLTGNCNLAEIHLNQIDPQNYKEQEEAFTAGALSVAVLLNHKFIEPRYQYSRELDPIVGVSFTGLFDFFVHAFGVEWLQWWAEGRPENPQGLTFKHQEQEYLSRWKQIVHRVVGDYCNRHGLKPPNRCTTVQPSGTKSLLTGASPGWHPPKAQRFIRRITCRKNDPVALAGIDYGYNVVPSQSDKDENGNLLNDPFDPRCTEWLLEIPVAVSWADLPGADQIDISKFSALAQMDFYMQVQKFYTAHNTSATIELRENEVEALGTRIYEAIRDHEGYISAALLARFDDLQTFPRLPFEPISKQEYEKLMQEVKMRRQTDDFHAALSRYDNGELMEAGPAGCDSDKCMLPEETPR